VQVYGKDYKSQHNVSKEITLEKCFPSLSFQVTFYSLASWTSLRDSKYHPTRQYETYYYISCNEFELPSLIHIGPQVCNYVIFTINSRYSVQNGLSFSLLS